MEVLPPLDHSQIEYEPFRKKFYSEHVDITKMTNEEVDAFRKELDVQISGNSPVRPIRSFAQAGMLHV